MSCDNENLRGVFIPLVVQQDRVIAFYTRAEQEALKDIVKYGLDIMKPYKHPVEVTYSPNGGFYLFCKGDGHNHVLSINLENRKIRSSSGLLKYSDGKKKIQDYNFEECVALVNEFLSNRIAQFVQNPYKHRVMSMLDKYCATKIIAFRAEEWDTPKRIKEIRDILPYPTEVHKLG